MKKRKVKRRKKILLAAIVLDFVMILMISYTMAFFTSFDMVTNRFVAKPMDIALREERYDTLTEQQKSTLVPYRILPKDPLIQNTEQTDVYVFMKVTVPVGTLSNVADDGTVYGSQQRQEVFWLKTAAEVDARATSFHLQDDAGDTAYWVELSSFEEGTDGQSNTRTYVFGYSVYLRAYEMTETLFDYIELKNIRQFEIDPNVSLDILVDAYGVQADGLEGIDKDSEGGKTILTQEQLSNIYSFIHQDEMSEQNG